MIPPHKPAFGIGKFVAASLTAGEGRGITELEAAYARMTGGLHAVWLPSARAGICWALKAAIRPGDKVMAPAFTCGAVHEAVVRSGGIMQPVDAAEDDFLMAAEALTGAQTGRHAVVLCELYGHEYDLTANPTAAGLAAGARPVIRIVDMAMAVPRADLGRRLSGNDFAVISFGIGKSMYAGWGAMGLAVNQALVDEVRKLRDAKLRQGDSGLRWRRTARIGIRLMGHYPPVYSMAKKLRPQKFADRERQSIVEKIPAAWLDDKTAPAEWTAPATPVDCGLALWNLDQAASFHEKRVELAHRYHERLEGVPDLIRPKTSPSALSHYTIRVNAAMRTRFRRALFQSGINTITMWEFPEYLDRNQFPNAFQRSSEVVNLPLIPGMKLSRIDWICDQLKRCLALVRQEASFD